MMKTGMLVRISLAGGGLTSNLDSRSPPFPLRRVQWMDLISMPSQPRWKMKSVMPVRTSLADAGLTSSLDSTVLGSLK
jgi:hypothetical protein